MAEKRIVVWVQRFKHREHFVLQWIDPVTSKRKSESAKTADEKEAEQARGDLEADLNAGRYAEASRMSWEGFGELFTEEYLSGLRPDTRCRHDYFLDLFEKLFNPTRLRSIDERTISGFVVPMRTHQPYGKREGSAPSTIRASLEFLQTALRRAAQQRLIPACPVSPSVKVPGRKPKPIPTESVERLLDEAPDQNMRAFLLAGWLGGLRLREAYFLEREETKAAPYLDLAGSGIVFPAKFVKATEDPWVPLNPVLREVLDALPRHGRRSSASPWPRGRVPVRS